MQIQKEKGKGRQEAAQHAVEYPTQGILSNEGKPECPPNGGPGRGDQLFNLKDIPSGITESELADFTNGEIEEVGDASSVLRMCEKLLPAVRHLPTWKEPKWTDDVTVGKILALISNAVKDWSNDFSDYYPVCGVAYGDPRVRVEKKDKMPGVWVLWAYRTSQLSTTPGMSFLKDLKKKSPALYKIFCLLLGKLNTVTGVELWNHFTDYGEMSNHDYIDSWPNDDPDPGFVSEFEDAQTDLEQYWNEAGPVLKDVRKLSLRSLKVLKQCVGTYRWDTPYKKKIRVWIEAGIALVETKKKVYDYHCSDVIISGDVELHPAHYTWFRWYGNGSSSYVETSVDQALEDHFNEGGFMPFRKLIRYQNDLEFNRVKADTFPKDFETFMLNGMNLFYGFSKKINRKS